MAKKRKKRSNKAKFSLYLDKDVMKLAALDADNSDRSVNYVVNQLLIEKYQPTI